MTERTAPLPESTYERLTDAADQAFLKNGAIPIAFGDVSEAAGVSRALVYSHFSSPEELVNAVLSRHVKLIEARADKHPPPPEVFQQDLKQTLDIYFDHLCNNGPILHLASQDAFMAGKFRQDYTRLRNGTLTRLSRKARYELKVSPSVAQSLVLLSAGVAEEAARLARANAFTHDTARQTMSRIVDLMLDGLKLESGASSAPAA